MEGKSAKALYAKGKGDHDPLTMDTPQTRQNGMLAWEEQGLCQCHVFPFSTAATGWE